MIVQNMLPPVVIGLLFLAGCGKKETPEAIRAEMASVEDFSPEFEEHRFRLLQSVDEIRQREGVVGYRQLDSTATPSQSDQPPPRQQLGAQSAYVDPESGKVAWRALGCFNPACAGRPNGSMVIVARPFSHIQVSPSGDLIIGTPNMAELEKPFPCPVCSSQQYWRSYDPPESVLRRQELEAELAAAYAAYNSGGRRAVGGRPPNEILEDIANLPKLFLIPEGQ